MQKTFPCHDVVMDVWIFVVSIIAFCIMNWSFLKNDGLSVFVD